MLKVVENGALREASGELSELDEIARAGARRMLLAALETEAADYVERHRHDRDESGRALVVNNGQSHGRKLTLGAGTLELKAPQVNDRRRMRKENSLWGAPRIHGELLMLGIEVAESTGARYLRRRQGPPSQVLKAYASYYNEVRTHLSLDKNAPDLRPALQVGDIAVISILGGLHYQYLRVELSSRHNSQCPCKEARPQAFPLRLA
jgi:hypothetical protein